MNKDLIGFFGRSPWNFATIEDGIVTDIFGNKNDAFVPATDIEVREKETIVKADLPGFDKNTINVVVDNKMLTISGERKEEKTTKNRVERFVGSFERSFKLRNEIDQENIKAQLENGVLTITCPHVVKKETKKITIE